MKQSHGADESPHFVASRNASRVPAGTRARVIFHVHKPLPGVSQARVIEFFLGNEPGNNPRVRFFSRRRKFRPSAAVATADRDETLGASACGAFRAMRIYIITIASSFFAVSAHHGDAITI